MHSVLDTSDADPSYAQGLRESTSVAIDHALEVIERGEGRPTEPPPALRAQARMASRNGIGLDTVLRRYFAGYTMLGEFLASACAGGGSSPGVVPAPLLQDLAAAFDRLVATVSEEYQRESASWRRSPEQRHAERIQRILAGGQADVSEFDYDFTAQHTGLVASGPALAETIRELATALDRRFLIVHREPATAWAWLGGRRSLNPAEIGQALGAGTRSRIAISIGEPAHGLGGWRLTHRQAAAAHPITLRRAQGPVRYAKVALLASALRDDLLAASLHSLYLAPLEAERDGGEKLRRTLRAHFATDGHISSTASVLGVNRNTVVNRRHKIEALLGRTLGSCAAELETALALDEFRRLPDPPVV